MKIAYEHLLRRIKENPSINEISEKLFQLGHENEIINSNIFDIEFTPNRGDCLSIDGILRDLSIFYDVNKKSKFYMDEIDNLDINFKNNCTEACPKISFLKVQIDEVVEDYQDELKDYYEILEPKKNNFFTDVSNYISYETGQPTHCYDFNKIEGDISFEEIEGEFSFVDLMGNKIELKNKNHVFKLKNKIINLAGIMGGKSSSCSLETNTILIECAFFNPESIIGKSLKYNINSDAAHKFERGVDFSSHDYVLRRFIEVISKHTNIIKKEIFTTTYKNYKKKEIKFDKNVIDKILGYEIPNKKFIEYLDKLEFEFKNNKIIVPMHRTDVSNLNDIAEEIARCIGYNNIPAKEITIPTNNLKIKDRQEQQVKDFLIDNGFYEVINFPFIANKSINAVRVDNPLDSNKQFLRTNLRDSLVKNLTYNERRQQDSIKLFEISNLYRFENNAYSSEKVIGLIASGRLAKNYENFSKNISIEYLNGILKKYISQNKLNLTKINREDLNSQLKSPIIYAELRLKDFSKDILEYKKMHSTPKDFPQYHGVSEYPLSIRDLSFAIKDYSKLSILEDTILNFSNPILKNVYIFDYYINEKINEIKIGFRFTFQSMQDTITDEQIEKIMNKIIELTLKIESITIPGLIK